MADLIALMADAVKKMPPRDSTWWCTVPAWAGMWGITEEEAETELQGNPNAVDQGDGCWKITIRGQ